MIFSPTIVSRYFSFCVSSEFAETTGTIPVQLKLGGINAMSYRLSSSLVTIKVVTSTSQINPGISLSISATTINSTTFVVGKRGDSNVDTLPTYPPPPSVSNADGTMYWNLFASISGTSRESSTGMSLADIKSAIKDSNTIIEAQADNLTTLYTFRRESTVGLLAVSAVSDA